MKNKIISHWSEITSIVSIIATLTSVICINMVVSPFVKNNFMPTKGFVIFLVFSTLILILSIVMYALRDKITEKEISLELEKMLVERNDYSNK